MNKEDGGTFKIPVKKYTDNWDGSMTTETIMLGIPCMSLRDYFAASALPQIIDYVGIPEDGSDELWDQSIARRCYAIADAMLEVRKEAE